MIDLTGEDEEEGGSEEGCEQAGGDTVDSNGSAEGGASVDGAEVCSQNHEVKQS